MRQQTVGQIIIVFAVVATVVVSLSGGEISFPAIPIGLVGVILVVRGRREESRRMTGDEFEQSLGRTGPSKGKQIVGELCAACDKSIMTTADGAFCEACEAPIHHRCASDHRLAAHRPLRPPYR